MYVHVYIYIHIYRYIYIYIIHIHIFIWHVYFHTLQMEDVVGGSKLVFLLQDMAKTRKKKTTRRAKQAQRALEPFQPRARPRLLNQSLADCDGEAATLSKTLGM